MYLFHEPHCRDWQVPTQNWRLPLGGTPPQGLSPPDFLDGHKGLAFWGVSISPPLAAPGLHGEADAGDFMLSAAEHPNKETPLFPSEWMCLGW